MLSLAVYIENKPEKICQIQIGNWQVAIFPSCRRLNLIFVALVSSMICS